MISVIFIFGCTALAAQPIENGPPIETYFCPKDNCEQTLISYIEHAKYSVHCAFYDLDLEKLIDVLNQKAKEIDVKLVMDSDNYFDQTKNIPIVLDDDNQLSHNKFCVIDKKIVTTGSFNPTENGNEKNNNNLMIIPSAFLADNYQAEFEELWNRQFGKGRPVANEQVVYDDIIIKNYFCPDDNCASHLINEILNAKESIYFMTFSFTDENVADAILFSKVEDIKGVMEKSQAMQQYSQYSRLKDFGIDVKLDNNSAFMHHKVFILDNETVITGSYNPTSSGNNRNDENMLIIHDKSIAEMFVREFISLS